MYQIILGVFMLLLTWNQNPISMEISGNTTYKEYEAMDDIQINIICHDEDIRELFVSADPFSYEVRREDGEIVWQYGATTENESENVVQRIRISQEEPFTSDFAAGYGYCLENGSEDLVFYDNRLCGNGIFAVWDSRPVLEGGYCAGTYDVTVTFKAYGDINMTKAYDCSKTFTIEVLESNELPVIEETLCDGVKLVLYRDKSVYTWEDKRAVIVCYIVNETDSPVEICSNGMGFGTWLFCGEEVVSKANENVYQEEDVSQQEQNVYTLQPGQKLYFNGDCIKYYNNTGKYSIRCLVDIICDGKEIQRMYEIPFEVVE